MAVRGLGLVDVVGCPHFSADQRRPSGAASIAARRRRTILGLDDCAALVVVDDEYRIMSAREGSGVHLVDPSGEMRGLAPGSSFHAAQDPWHLAIRMPGPLF